MTSPPTASAQVPCVDVDHLEHPSKGVTVGGVRAGPFGDYLRDQHGGSAKFWVGQKPFVGPADALIRVEVPSSGTVAYYVRPWKRRATPVPPDSSEPTGHPFYPGAIMLPRPGERVRITVTIGDASGCFLFTT